MTGPLDIGITLAKNSGSLVRNLFGILADMSLAGNRVLVADQTRKLAERYAVAESVIDTMMERELEMRAAPTHGIRLEVKQPAIGSWSGERINGSLYVTVRNEWVHPATLTKLVATLEPTGYRRS